VRVPQFWRVLFFMQQSIFFGSMLCFVIVLRNFAGRNISQKTLFDGIVFVAGGVLLFFAWCSFARGITRSRRHQSFFIHASTHGFFQGTTTNAA